MANAAEWRADVNAALPTLKQEFFDGTKTKEEYDTAVAALLTSGNDVDESALKQKVITELQVASSLA